jgi:hypothetical protein
MGAFDIAEEKDHFIHTASMGYLVSGQSCQPHFRNELIDKDDNTNGADEASQEWPTEDIVQEAEPEDTGHKDKRSSQACHNASNFGVSAPIVVPSCALFDILAHYFTNEERTRRFRPDNHLRAGAQNCVYQRVQGEAVETVYGWNMGEVRGIRERHRDVEGCHGDCSNQVAFEISPFVLLRPVEYRNIVLEVHHPLVLDAMEVCKPSGGAFLLPVAVYGRITQQRVCCVGRISLCRFCDAWERAHEAVVGMYAACKTPVISVHSWARRVWTLVVRGVQVLLVQQSRADGGLEIDLYDAALLRSDVLVN